MSANRCPRICLLVAAVPLLMQATLATAESGSAPAAAAPVKTSQDVAAQRDGQHDFDWMHGTWKATLKRLVKPLTGSTTWVEFEGKQTTRQLWDGRANIDEFVVDNAATKTNIQGLTLRLYNPETREWSLYWANARKGTLAMPPTVGRFDGKGRGEFYNREDFDGKPIVVRYTWSNITANSAHFEQAFSPDDGKTWETNWISDLTRIKESH
jgi:hypothetical protein